MRRFLFVSLLVVWCMAMSERAVYAYMDPGSGSMFLQLVLGGAAGIGLIVKLYWRKLLSLVGLRSRDPHPEQQPHV
jgi:hypothetical protein